MLPCDLLHLKLAKPHPNPQHQLANLRNPMTIAQFRSSLLQETSTCTRCWSSNRPRSPRVTSWAVTTPMSSPRLAQGGRNAGLKGVQPEGENHYVLNNFFGIAKEYSV